MAKDGQRRDVRREVFPTEGLWDEMEIKPEEGQSDQDLVIEV